MSLQPAPGHAPAPAEVAALPKSDSRYVGSASTVLRCSERAFEGSDQRAPVKLVVFDLDETITMATFMPNGGRFEEERFPMLTEYNFQSPWAGSSRLESLRNMFTNLASGAGSTKHGKAQQRKTLAVLTRNEAGVKNVLQLLQMVGLDMLFTCIWTMPWDEGAFNGAFRVGETWEFFDPPLMDITDHKADVLHHLCSDPSAFFPQLRGGAAGPAEEVAGLAGLRPEQIILVDDQRNNFMSETGKRVLRFAKVARYEAHYRQAGVIHDMGGIGAHDEGDYEKLQKFVRMPWEFPETMELRCWERSSGGAEHGHGKVELVVFDFDETLTLATFTPIAEGFFSQIGWTPGAGDTDWTIKELVSYNFESPFTAEENRVQHLQNMFRKMSTTEDGSPRTLAILARHQRGGEQRGAIGLLNLLMMAGLDEFFTAVWSMPSDEKYASGAYKDGGEWKPFNAPVSQVPDHKAEVLDHLRADPAAWFPQLGRLPQREGLSSMKPEGIVLVDDERTNFRSTVGGKAKVFRVAKVARYDEEYRDCGLLLEMGGIGAHNQTDYSVLCDFVARPCDFPKEGHHSHEATKAHEQMETIDVRSPDAAMVHQGSVSKSQRSVQPPRARKCFPAT